MKGTTDPWDLQASRDENLLKEETVTSTPNTGDVEKVHCHAVKGIEGHPSVKLRLIYLLQH
jgi:hypothetical protein